MSKVHAYSNVPIRYNPYQYLPLYKMNQCQGSNLLITDEVGLGKTIEAGIIIDDFLQNNKNVFVICPAFLRDKWREELEDKFYLTSSIYQGKKQTFLNDECNVQIIPMSRLKQFVDAKFHMNINESLIIVDEAHYYRNRTSSRYKYLHNIIKSAKNSKIVFMTATPVNNDEKDFDNVLRLLDNGKPITITNTTKLEAYIELKKRTIKDLWIDLSDTELDIYEEVDKLPPFSGTIYRHIASGCLYSVVKYSEKNTNFDESISDIYNMLSLENDEDFDEEKQTLDYLNIETDLPRYDTKLNKLYDIIQNHPKEKIVIFAHYIETVIYIAERLKQYYRKNHKNKENIAYIFGNNVSDNIPVQNKKNKFLDVKDWFDKGKNSKILVCSDACKEGVDLDSASVLINYDLPFNPAIVEQRIGRIDRMSQKSDMTIYNFHVNNTYDDRLNAILNMKLRYISNISKYGVGNPLNINSKDADIIINKYIKYFENRDYSNEDVSIIKKVMHQLEIKLPRENKDKKIYNTNLKKVVMTHKNQIIDWLKNDVNNVEKEILEEHFIELDDKLGFKKVPDLVTIKINSHIKKNILKMFEETNDFFKILPILKVPNEYYDSLEEYGERKILCSSDIKNEHTIDYKNPKYDNFIPYEIVKEWLTYEDE